MQSNQTLRMRKSMPIDQNSQQMIEVCLKNGTTISCCGYITAALADYLTHLPVFTWESLSHINLHTLQPYIQKAMGSIAAMRRFEVKKYYKMMNEGQRKNYMKDWVANYELVDYLESLAQGQIVNKQLYFFRQVAFDHPQALQDLRWEEKERISQEECFKGQGYFVSAFGPYINYEKHEFEAILKNRDVSKPVIIATDVLGHFNITILFGGEVHILDSLTSYIDNKYDSGIVEAIAYYYRASYLIK